MSLKLFESRRSTCTQTVLVTLREKGVDVEFHALGLADIKTAEHLKKHPFGQMPVLEDGDFQIYESRAVAKYIASKYADQGTKLVPPANDLQAQAKLEQAAQVEICDWFPAVSGIVDEKLFKTFRGQETNVERVKEHAEVLNKKLDVYEQILSKQEFIAGNELSIVDLYHLPHGHLITNALMQDFLTTSARPNVARWWKDISSRPAWKEVVAEGAMS